MSKDKTRRVLASLVMGMNLVNSIAVPLNSLAIEQHIYPTVQAQNSSRGESAQLINRAMNIVDRLVFGKAEAFVENIGGGHPTTIAPLIQHITSNGGINDAGVADGGNIQRVYNGGTVRYADNNVYAGGTQIIYTGGSVINLDVFLGGSSDIDGGHLTYVWVYAGGTQTVHNSGVVFTSDNWIMGYQSVYDGGTVNTVNVKNGGTQVIGKGGTALGVAYVATGGTQIIESGGSANNIAVNGGRQEVLGGTATNIVINNGGIQSVASAAGTAGYVSGVTVKAGGTQEINNGGIAYNNLISAGGIQNISGGTATSNSISSSGVQNINGGTATSNSISSGGVQNISGGTAAHNTVSGTQVVYGGTATDTQINSGATQDVRGGSALNTELLTGATQNVSDGIATSTTVRTGAVENITGGITSDTTVDQGGIQNVSGGIAYATSVSGTQRIYSSGKADGTIVSNSGVQEILGGTADNTTIFSSGKQTLSESSARANNTIISGGISEIDVGYAYNTSVYQGGTQNINSSGSADSVFVYAGGTQNINSGKANDVYVYAGGVQNISGGTATDTKVQAAGVQNISGGTAVSTTLAGVQNLSVGIASATTIQSGGQQIQIDGLTDETIIETGGTQSVSGGTAKNITLNGGISEIYNNTILVENVTINSGVMRLGADGANYTMEGTFNLNGGTVDMVSNPNGAFPNPRTYETLTINNLTGNGGTFKLDTDLNSAVYGSETTNGDKIVINSGTSGVHYIQVADASLYTGTEITGDRKLLLVTDNSGSQNLNYVGKDLNNGGVWLTHAPTLFKEGNKWYLGYIKKEPSNDTTVYLSDRQVVAYNQWTRINNDSLRKRLGDLRYNDVEAGAWARFYGGELSGNGYDQRYQTYQVGIDKTNGRSTYGLAYERQLSNQSYSYGSGNGTTNTFDAYFTHYTDTGSYFDSILKYGRIASEYYTIGDFPDHAEYTIPAYSLSVEYGKTNRLANGYFFEPKVQLTYGHLISGSYYTDRGTKIEESSIRSLISKLGFTVGRQLNNMSDYYFKAGWFKEFRGTRDVHLKAANGENMYKSYNYGDTWFELGLGFNMKVSKKTHIYGDIERSIGAEINKKWQVNVGARWEL